MSEHEPLEPLWNKYLNVQIGDNEKIRDIKWNHAPQWTIQYSNLAGWGRWSEHFDTYDEMVKRLEDVTGIPFND